MENIVNIWRKYKPYILSALILAIIFILGQFFVKKSVTGPINYVATSNVINEKYASGTVLPNHSSTISSIAFSPDGTKMVITGSDPKNNLILWDISDFNNVKSMQLFGHLDMVNDAAFSPDGNKIVSGGKGKRKNLIVWDISDIHHITSTDFNDPNEGVWAVAFSPDGSKIVSGSFKDSDESNCIIWDALTGKRIANLAADQYFVSSLAFSPNGNKVVTGDWWGDENSLILWDIKDINNIEKTILSGHPGNISGVAFSPDGNQIVSGGKRPEKLAEKTAEKAAERDSKIVLWNISDINNIKSTVLSNEPVAIRSVAFSHDGKMIASGDMGGQDNITLWNAQTGKKIINLDGQQNGVWSVAFRPNSKQLASGGHYGEHNLILWTLLLE